MTNVLAFPEKLCRVLVIDANPATAAGVRDALSQVSPRVRVYSAPDLDAAVPRLARDSWDLVVLQPWKAVPGKPMPISIIRKAGYRGPVVPVTLGGPPIKRRKPAPARAQQPQAETRPAVPSPAHIAAAPRRQTVPAMISQLLDESFASA